MLDSDGPEQLGGKVDPRFGSHRQVGWCEDTRPEPRSDPAVDEGEV
jgi:hypothetical protein